MGLIQTILENRTNSVLKEKDLIGPFIHPLDEGATYLGQDTYEVYHALGLTFKPKSILEIGVRFGYSMRCMTLGSGLIETAYGIDNEYDSGGSLDYVRCHLHNLIPNLQLHLIDSQKVDQLPVKELIDLAHVDAWHTADGCYHDCVLVHKYLKPNGILLVDDVGTGGELVREGADRFCKQHQLTPYYLPSYRGMYVIPLGV